PHRAFHSFPTRRSSDLAVAVVVELGHHRSIGIEGIADDGVDEPSVGLVQGIDQTPPGGQFASMALMLGVDIAESFLVEHWFDPQDRKSTRLNSSHLVIS